VHRPALEGMNLRLVLRTELLLTLANRMAVDHLRHGALLTHY
jgi:hypothetical protein